MDLEYISGDLWVQFLGAIFGVIFGVIFGRFFRRFIGRFLDEFFTLQKSKLVGNGKN